MDMSIAAMSVDMNLAKTQQDLMLALLKMQSMPLAAAAVDDLSAASTAPSSDPALGNNVDISA